MKYFLLLLLIPSVSFAQWTNWPNPKGSAVSKKDCESIFGGTCVFHGVIQTDEIEVVGGNVFVDPIKVQARLDAEAADKAEIEARRLKLIELKGIVESKDPTPEELREALKILLSDVKLPTASALRARP